MKLFISTYPFAQYDVGPLQLLQNIPGLTVEKNPFSRRLTTAELENLSKNSDVLIASTEKISTNVLDNSPNLKLIARTGIGLDNVPLDECKKRNIKVTNCPDGPTQSVAELNIAFVLDCLRYVSLSTEAMKHGQWQRKTGYMLKNRKCGIVGFGRVGQATALLLRAFGAKVKARDIAPDNAAAEKLSVEFLEKKQLLEWSDTLFLTVPLSSETKNYIQLEELTLLGEQSVLVNTSRGGIVCESDLEVFLKSNASFFAGMDVFISEPYDGKLANQKNFIGTCHMGASTRESRKNMELSAANSVHDFLKAFSLKKI